MSATLFNISPYRRQPEKRRLVKDMPAEDRPMNRIRHVGFRALSVSELLAICLQTPDSLDLAREILDAAGGVRKLAYATTAELTAVSGIGKSMACRILAAIELGRRSFDARDHDKVTVCSPADAANLLMAEMSTLEQEHLVVILLNTRNAVLSVETVYIGSLNTSVVRVGELFNRAIRQNAAAIIVAHNHPSGDPAPSPEDVRVTSQFVSAGKLLDIDVLDHVIIGAGRFVSLKERGLGFD